MATKKILEKMKQDENLRSFEGSSGPLSDDLEDSDDDDDGLSQVGCKDRIIITIVTNLITIITTNLIINIMINLIINITSLLRARQALLTRRPSLQGGTDPMVEQGISTLHRSR